MTAGGAAGRQPVIYVDWHQAQSYVTWLSTKTGGNYRLLSDSEWEYVARAGACTTFWWGDEAGTGNAVCKDCGSKWDGKSPAPVGQSGPQRLRPLRYRRQRLRMGRRLLRQQIGTGRRIRRHARDAQEAERLHCTPDAGRFLEAAHGASPAGKHRDGLAHLPEHVHRFPRCQDPSMIGIVKGL